MKMYGNTPDRPLYNGHPSTPIDRLSKLRELMCSRLRVIWTAVDGTETVVAETENGYRVLETT